MFNKPVKLIDSDSFFDFLKNTSELESESISLKKDKIKVKDEVQEQTQTEINDNQQKHTKIYRYIGDDIPWLL